VECTGSMEGSNYVVVAARGVDGSTDVADSVTARRRASRSSHGTEAASRHIHGRTARSAVGNNTRCTSLPACVRVSDSAGAHQDFAPIFYSLSHGCDTMVRVTCSSRSKPGGLRILLSHVQPLHIGVDLACTLVCVCACGGVSCA
jgi:hypothetical protein